MPEICSAAEVPRSEKAQEDFPPCEERSSVPIHATPVLVENAVLGQEYDDEKNRHADGDDFPAMVVEP